MDLNNLNLKNISFGGVESANDNATARPMPETEEIKKESKSVELEKDNTQMPNTIKVNDATPTIVLNLKDIIDKINNIKKDMNAMFVDREDIINSIILAVASRQHIVLVGDPGTGKSFLIDNFVKRIDGAKHFNWQLTRTTDPSELFGPFSIKEMENDRFMRKTEGTLVDSQFCYLDECYKANSAILNSLLQIMNERTFNNDGKRIKCPLITIFASSNEWGEDESLEAFTDRFVFKHEVNYLRTKKNVTKLLMSKAKGMVSTYTEKLTLDEISFLHDEVETVTIDKLVIEGLVKLLSDLKTNGSTISDRKACQCIDILKANAILNNRKVVNKFDYKSLAYVLWDGKSSIDDINDIILNNITEHYQDYISSAKDYNNMVKNFFKIETAAERIRESATLLSTLAQIVSDASSIVTNMDKSDAMIAIYNDYVSTVGKFRTFVVNLLAKDPNEKVTETEKDYMANAKIVL